MTAHTKTLGRSPRGAQTELDTSLGSDISLDFTGFHGPAGVCVLTRDVGPW